jgi:hypothetical protein
MVKLARFPVAILIDSILSTVLLLFTAKLTTVEAGDVILLTTQDPACVTSAEVVKGSPVTCMFPVPV